MTWRKFLCLFAGVLLASVSRAADATDSTAGKPDTLVSNARVIRVGHKPGGTTIAEAARLARDGDTVEIEAGDYFGDVASWGQNDLTVRAVGGHVRIVAQGKAAEGKAIWVIKGTRFLVDGIEFTGARVPANNGAGIRHEGGKLTVRNCLFDGNQMGLLTWNDERSEVVIERSEFRDNAAAPSYRPGVPIGHQIYVGSIGRFTLRDSWIHHGAFGHLVKSRARESLIVNNRITDETGGKASYELEFPNGGIAYVIGNIIGQSATTENATVISFGAEGYRWPRSELYLVHNTLVDDLPNGGNFLRVYSGASHVEIVNNLLVGSGKLDTAAAQKSVGNVYAGPGDLPLAADYDYRLSRKTKYFGKAEDAGQAHALKLRPDREYCHPMRSCSVPGPPFSPGAIQSGPP